MPQTILAMLGLMLVAQFTLRQQAEITNGRLSMIEVEVSTIAAAVAVERLDQITAMPFDEAVKQGNVLTSPSALTAASDFRNDAPSDDVDDFDGSSITVAKPAGSDTLRFDVVTSVSYADETSPSVDASGRTKYKRIDVTVSTPDIAFIDTVRLERLASCGSSCSW